MALNYSEVQRVLEQAEAADSNRKEIRKALQRVQSLHQQLDVAIGDVLTLIDGDAPAPKEKKPYTGKPRGRKKKVEGGEGGDLFNASEAPAEAATPATTEATADVVPKKAVKAK